VKIEGFDELAKQFEEAQKATEALGSELGSIRFNPADAHDVQRAIKKGERLVKAKLSRYRHNPLVQQIAAGLRDACRQHILEEARKARG
jgi:hypothetical protein